jgi:hypothetical protein
MEITKEKRRGKKSINFFIHYLYSVNLSPSACGWHLRVFNDKMR